MVCVPAVPSHLDLMWTEPVWARALRRGAESWAGRGLRPTGARPVGSCRSRSHARGAGGRSACRDGRRRDRARNVVRVGVHDRWRCPLRHPSAGACGRALSLVAIRAIVQDDARGGLDRLRRQIRGDRGRVGSTCWSTGARAAASASSHRAFRTSACVVGGRCLERASASPAMVRAITEAETCADLTAILPLVEAPTVVVTHADSGVASGRVALCGRAHSQRRVPSASSLQRGGWTQRLVRVGDRRVRAPAHRSSTCLR